MTFDQSASNRYIGSNIHLHAYMHSCSRTHTQSYLEIRHCILQIKIFSLNVWMITPYHTCPRIWTSSSDYLLICPKMSNVANTENPDQMPHFVASDLGQHSLYSGLPCQHVTFSSLSFWTLPFLYLDMSTDANRGFSLKPKTEWQTV